MLQAELAAGLVEGFRDVAGAVVGHHPRHLDAEADVIGDGGLEEYHGALLPLVGKDLAEGDARGVVDETNALLGDDAFALEKTTLPCEEEEEDE